MPFIPNYKSLGPLYIVNSFILRNLWKYMSSIYVCGLHLTIHWQDTLRSSVLVKDLSNNFVLATLRLTSGNTSMRKFITLESLNVNNYPMCKLYPDNKHHLVYFDDTVSLLGFKLWVEQVLFVEFLNFVTQANWLFSFCAIESWECSRSFFEHLSYLHIK